MLKPPPVMSAYQPQSQVVTVHTLPTQKTTKVNYHHNTSRVLGGLQVIGGVLAMIFGGLLIWACSIAGVAGAGLWGGIFYLITGIFGLQAGKKQSRGYIQLYLVLCIITVFLSAGVIVACAVALANPNYHSNYCFNYSGFDTRGVVFECLLLIIGIILTITLIWGSYIACQAVCGCGNPPPPTPSKPNEKKEKENFGSTKNMMVTKDQSGAHNVSVISDEKVPAPGSVIGSDGNAAYYPDNSQTAGYYPDTSQTGYYSQDASYYSQQGYVDPNQQGYDPNQQGYDPNQQGYDPNQQGYDPNQQGYYPQGYDPNQQGYYDQGQGYDPSQGQYYANTPADNNQVFFPEGQGQPAPAPQPRKHRSSRGSRGSNRGQKQENQI